MLISRLKQKSNNSKEMSAPANSIARSSKKHKLTTDDSLFIWRNFRAQPQLIELLDSIVNEDDELEHEAAVSHRSRFHQLLKEAVESVNKMSHIRSMNFPGFGVEAAVELLDVNPHLLAHSQLSCTAFNKYIDDMAAKSDWPLDLSSETLPVDLVKRIYDRMHRIAQCTSSLWDVENESNRSKFMMAIVEAIVGVIKEMGSGTIYKKGAARHFQLHSNIPSRMQDDADQPNPIAFVQMQQQVYLFLTHTKREQMNQGIVQNIFQLRMAYEANMLRFPVFGLVSDGQHYKLLCLEMCKPHPAAKETEEKIDPNEVIGNEERGKTERPDETDSCYITISGEMSILTPTVVNHDTFLFDDSELAERSLTPIAETVWKILRLQLHNASPV